MMLGKQLQKVLNSAIQDVHRRHHEFLTLEHVLFAMTKELQGRVLLEGCGASPVVLQEQLERFFRTYVEAGDDFSTSEVMQTQGLQRVLEKSFRHIQSAGRDTVELGDILAAIMEEEDSYAHFYLRKQGVTRMDVLTFISHGMEDGNGSTGTVDSPQDEDEGGVTQLEKYTTDLTARAAEGRIDPLVGRETELERAVEVLCRRRKNNPLFVGEAGVGKTAMAEGLALHISEGRVPERFLDARVFALDMGALLAGARYRGDFEARVKGVLSDLRKIHNAILFIDEIHTLVGAGSTSGGSVDAANLLKPLLAEGVIRCMGSTTHEEYRNHLEKDRGLARRFQRIDISEPTVEQCAAILRGLQQRYAEHHNVRYPAGTLKAAVELSARHVQERMLPDKAIDVMDEAGAMVRLRAGNKPTVTVTVSDIEKVVARMAGIPERSVSGQERQKLATLERDLRAVVFGQDEAVGMTVKAILRSRAGLKRDDRPAGAFLFYGPTGVGKTELARQLAQLLGVQFLRYDMSEYMEKHAVSRLIGAPPGYVGFDQGGLLTEAVRKAPYSLVLLDEIEKAHPDIFNVLLQVMDYATLTDNTGRKADFRNVILIMTSNAGARDMAQSSIGFGKASPEDAAARGLKAVNDAFTPEFRNRLDAMVPFNGLSEALMGRIVDKFVHELRARLKARKVRVELTDTARQWLAVRGYDPAFGARPLQRVIRSELEDPLAQELLFGTLVRGGTVTVDAPQADAPRGATRKGRKAADAGSPAQDALVFHFEAR